MSICTIASSKGGAGKTTIAEIVIGVMCPRGKKIAVVDADLNGSLSNWVERFEHPASVYRELDEEKLFSLIANVDAEHDLTIVDTAGSAGRATMFAMAQSDLVLVPVKPSEQDLSEAAKTIELVKEAANIASRDIKTFVVVNDFKPRTAIEDHVDKEIAELGLPALKTKIEDLVAFQEMSFNGQVPTRGKAGIQVRKFMGELGSLGVLDFEDKSWLASLWGRVA